jgi:FkbM family methyltransferase
VIAALRRIERLPAVRRFLRQPRVEPIVATVLRASPVRRIGLFLGCELRGSTAPARYRLRGEDAVVFVRHRTPDVAALGEVFYERQYEPPPLLARRLEAAPAPLRILDLGANVGLFGVFAMHRFPGAELTAVEPDASNLDLLNRTMTANRWRWNVISAAAATSDGEVRFASEHFTTSRIDPDGEIVSAVDAFPLLQRSGFAKIDIEGGEWSILEDSRLAAEGCPLLVLEYHPHLCPSDDPRGEAHGRLRAAGYELEEHVAFGAGHGLLWAWR